MRARQTAFDWFLEPVECVPSIQVATDTTAPLRDSIRDEEADDAGVDGFFVGFEHCMNTTTSDFRPPPLNSGTTGGGLHSRSHKLIKICIQVGISIRSAIQQIIGGISAGLLQVHPRELEKGDLHRDSASPTQC